MFLRENLQFVYTTTTSFHTWRLNTFHFFPAGRNKLEINRTFCTRELIDVQPGSDLSLNSSLSLTRNMTQVHRLGSLEDKRSQRSKVTGWERISLAGVVSRLNIKDMQVKKRKIHYTQTADNRLHVFLVFWLLQPRPHVQMKRGSGIQMRLLSVLVVCSLLCFCFVFFTPDK